MTIESATKKLFASEEFKAAAKLTSNAKLRIYLSRYNKGTLSDCGAIELLQQFGYKIDVLQPAKKNK